jgi:hypothetical protein
VRQLAARELVHPGQILHAAGTSIRLKGYGDDLLSGKSVAEFFAEYLADIERADALEAAPELFGLMGGSYAALVYNEHDTKEFAAVNQLVAAASARALDCSMKRAAVDLIFRLTADPENGSMLYEWSLRDRNYGGVAILNHIPFTQFADLLLVDGKLNDKLMAALHECYQHRYETELAPELDWLHQLRTELSQRISMLAPPYRQFGELRLPYWFKEIDQRIASAHTPTAQAATE